MKQRMDPLFVALSLILLGLANTQSSHYKRFCYVTTWAQYRSGQATFNPEDIGATLCTHLSVAFSTLDDTGTQLKATDPSYDPALYKRFNAVKKGHPHLKTFLSVGGWTMGSDLFTKLVSSDSNINKFAHNTVKYLRDHGFDGLDLDWEFPADRGSPAGDKERFTKLAHTLHQVFHSTRGNGSRLLLSAALNPLPSRVATSYEPAKLGRYLDIINLMTYDMHGEWDRPMVTGHHAALYGTSKDPQTNIDYVANYWARLGVPKNKILIGLPFYARTVSLNDTSVSNIGAAYSGPGREGELTNEKGTLAYFEVCKILKDGTESHVIANQSVPYFVDHERWGGYDDEKSLQAKVQYVIDHGFGGVMVWALDLDDFSGICGKKFPLMHAIKDTFQSVVGK